MDDAKDLTVDINEPRGYEEGARSDQLFPLLLLQHLDLLLGRNLFLRFFTVLLDLFSHLVAHLLHADGDLSPFLLDQLLQLLVIIGFLPESNCLARVSFDLVVLKP